MPHNFQTRIYYEDTDAAGVVYYANYLKFAERARTEWLRVLGVEQGEILEKTGVGFVVRRCNVCFMSPARLDDVIDVETSLQKLTKARITMRQIISLNKKILVELEVELAAVDRKFRPTRIPADIINIMEK